MHGKANPRPERGVQRAVLALALDAHPKALTIPDLAKEIDKGDRTEQAARDLVAIGLLEAPGLSVVPTAAALRFAELELP
jgi:hypothetical protein